jgi:hypothetical protein
MNDEMKLMQQYIADLEKGLESSLNLNKAQAERHTDNEPVAWLYERPSGAAKLSFVQEKILWEDTTETPLYTHPAKTLTDEEISRVGEEVFGYSFTAFEVADHYLNFARAILRKAQNG